MQGLAIVSILLLFTSCATRIKLPNYTLKEDTIHPGQTKRVVISLKDEKKYSLKCDAKEIASNRVGNNLVAFISAEYKFLEQKKSPRIDCFLETIYDDELLSFHVIGLNVVEFNYRTTKLSVPKKYTKLSDEDLEWWKRDQAELKEVYANTHKDQKLFKKPFVRPLQSKITARYGNRRTFNNTTQSYHSGTDFRARKPTPIPTSNDGVVIYSGHLLFNGKTVIVDHGMGILTMYCHFSKLLLKKGDIVKQGDILGLSGNTGRSNAPHLHWGVKVNGIWVDGLHFLEEQFNELVADYKRSPTK